MLMRFPRERGHYTTLHCMGGSNANIYSKLSWVELSWVK